MKIGFVGLGMMGRPMALNLKAAGHELFIPDRRSLTAELRAAATVVGDAAAVAEQAEVVILMVPDTPDVEAALFGPHGVVEGLQKGTLVIDMSSISPVATKEFAAARGQAGLRLPRCAGLRRRGGCQAGDVDHHGGRRAAAPSTAPSRYSR